MRFAPLVTVFLDDPILDGKALTFETVETGNNQIAFGHGSVLGHFSLSNTTKIAFNFTLIPVRGISYSLFDITPRETGGGFQEEEIPDEEILKNVIVEYNRGEHENVDLRLSLFWDPPLDTALPEGFFDRNQPTVFVEATYLRENDAPQQLKRRNLIVQFDEPAGPAETSGQEDASSSTPIGTDDARGCQCQTISESTNAHSIPAGTVTVTVTEAGELVFTGDSLAVGQLVLEGGTLKVDATYYEDGDIILSADDVEGEFDAIVVDGNEPCSEAAIEEQPNQDKTDYVFVEETECVATRSFATCAALVSSC